mmetsp:Transcript_3254/g.4393  ORF Transcript_3254/g.4393 Transcript_3254/m.4393 type:complete len:89 (+) Transcript_3254:41-307(+)|eukprot:CAMPEP_0185599794 /NCGR_PEP_ID=MMETSP0434-20130131/82946_1 /TAXON_ID=626734 ORGANISM="Favella taraikaensis, Strain Fe Narragansett Bay" /NCGR_SAMPLE_ID=MMETSP0434 /ASSEMBLY_ACC=CAM_ASM_000379 /LENGTH=88 /DNA_ID=CAMNT_0028229325 /DNA_START=34 /DNA_END=300 /DNA_ORIENTATION=+
MKLGGNTDAMHRGKKLDQENINKKPTKAADMYLMEEELNMMHRRIRDEYPLYAEDGTFERAISDPSFSPKKYTGYLAKKGSANQATHI